MASPSRLSNAHVASVLIADTTGAADGKPIFVAPFACKIIDVRALAATAPTGAAEIYDVNINGTTAFTTQANRPTIADAGTVSSTTLPDVVAVAEGDKITVDIDQVGSTTEALNVLVQVTFE